MEIIEILKEKLRANKIEEDSPIMQEICSNLITNVEKLAEKETPGIYERFYKEFNDLIDRYEKEGLCLVCLIKVLEGRIEEEKFLLSNINNEIIDDAINRAKEKLKK